MSRDEAVARIYAAAIEPDGLGTIAAILRTYLSADSAGLWMIDRDAITDIVQTDDIVASIDPYLAYYCRLDPWTASRKQPSRVYLSTDSVDETQLLESEFYRDFARHFGMRRPMGLVLTLDGQRSAAIALNRIAVGQFLGDAERRILQDLAVHLEGAFKLRARFLTQRQLSEGRAAALDGVTFGVVLCDAEGVIVTANTAAEAMGIGCGLRPIEVGRVLRGLKHDEDRALRGAIEAAARGAHGAARLTGSDDFALALIAVPDGRSKPGAGSGRALVYLSRADAETGPSGKILMRLFGLSPAQAALCKLLLAGRTFEEAAGERGIALSTARSHFQAALARTNTRNLRDLLRVLGSLPSLRDQT